MAQGRVLCVHPWIVDFAAYDLWIRPLGLLSIVAVLREHEYEIDWLDCMDRAHPALLSWQGLETPKDRGYGCGHYHTEIVDKPSILRDVPRHLRRYGLPTELFESVLDKLATPDVILVTSKMTYWYLGVHEAIRQLKERYPNVPLVLGGTYATLCYEHAKAHSGADHVIPGEGECSALRLVNQLTGGPVAGCEYTHPIPAHDLVHHRKASVLTTTRGCPMHCTYCASNILSQGFHLYPTDRVLAEIDACFDLGARHFAFYDDALLMRAEEHIHPILEAIIQRGYPVDFHTPNAVHAACINDALARQLLRARFRTIRMGLETVDPERQKLTGGKVSNASFARAVVALRKAGFVGTQIGAYVLVGLPGQTLPELESTVRFVHDQGAQVKLAFYSPIPGTVDWEQAVADGQIPADADPLLHNNTLLPLRTDTSWEQLERFKRWVYMGNRAVTTTPRG